MIKVTPNATTSIAAATNRKPKIRCRKIDGDRAGRLTNFLVLGEDLLQLLPHLSLGQLHVVFDIAGFHVREREVAGVTFDFELDGSCQ